MVRETESPEPNMVLGGEDVKMTEDDFLQEVVLKVQQGGLNMKKEQLEGFKNRKFRDGIRVFYKVAIRNYFEELTKHEHRPFNSADEAKVTELANKIVDLFYPESL